LYSYISVSSIRVLLHYIQTLPKRKEKLKKIDMNLILNWPLMAGTWRATKIQQELNTLAALELVLRCHLGPRNCKIKIWHPALVKLCHLGP